MKKKKNFKLTQKEKRELRRIGLSAVGGTSAVLAGAGFTSGHPEALILIPVSMQSFKLARKRGLTKKQKQQRIKALKHLFVSSKRKTRKVV